MNYFAHSRDDKPKKDWQPLYVHCLNVANLCGEYAKNTSLKELDGLTYFIGLFHDVGKYSKDFQSYISGNSCHKVTHASEGANELFYILQDQNSNQCHIRGILSRFLATSIACHHTGLVNGEGDGNGHENLLEKITGLNNVELTNNIRKELSKFFNNINPLDNLLRIQLRSNNISKEFSFFFLQLIIFSIVVDADYTDTTRFYRQEDFVDLSDYYNFSWDAVEKEINLYIGRLSKDSDISDIRQSILKKCIDKSERSCSKMFTLSVPTGGGKTLSSFLFATKYANRNGQTRIIYVAPYTSIIEQNAEVYRCALGKFKDILLEHHCSYDFSDVENEKIRSSLIACTETWNAPVIVTSAVQFFETLFSSNTVVSRKRHNITNSVIILDEFQCIPVGLLRPSLAVIQELTINYNCCVVLSTATMPPVKNSQDFYNGLSNVEDIICDSEFIYEKLKRVTVRYVGKKNNKQLMQSITDNFQILIIVNTRKQAIDLYKSAIDKDGLFVLTTYMCPAHRKQVIDTIRNRLRNDLSCKVISTSLIEAGVDIDFPYVMREECGIDSIAQSAGRCNREGKRLRSKSFVDVFYSEENRKLIPHAIRPNISSANAVINKYTDNFLCPNAITDYFKALYNDSDLDSSNILDEIDTHSDTLLFPYLDISNKYKLIDSFDRTIFVNFNEEAFLLISELQKGLDKNFKTVLNKLQKYSVQVSEKIFLQLLTEHRIEYLNQDRFGKNFVLLIGNDMYEKESGLNVYSSVLKTINSII